MSLCSLALKLWSLRVINARVMYVVQVGSVIGRVEARDADAGPNGLVHYGLAGQTQTLHGHLFSVRNSTGEIVVRSTIDRETASLYQLVIIAYDHGPDTLSAESTVAIHVDDVNDNSPTVTIHTLDSASSVSQMSEDSPVGSFVAYMSAADPDAGANGRVDCALGGVDAATFSLVQKYPSEYQIVTAAALDRERNPEYTLTVKCWDGGSPVSRITEQSFRLIVGDINDNAPVFSQQTYRGSLVENNYVGFSVLQVCLCLTAQPVSSLPREIRRYCGCFISLIITVLYELDFIN